MANGTDSEQFVLLSGVRTGLKREFAFALKAQSELSGSLGRTRARKIQNSPTANGVSKNSSNKRFKSSHAKKETKNDAVKHPIEEEPKSNLIKSLCGEEHRIDLAKTMNEEETKKDGSEEPNKDQEEREIDLAEPMSIEETKKDGSEESNKDQEEREIDLAKPMSEEETKKDGSEEPNKDQEGYEIPLAEPMSVETKKDGSEESNKNQEGREIDLAKPMSEEETKKDGSEEPNNDQKRHEIDLAKPMNEEETKKEGSEEPNKDQVTFPSERELKNEKVKPLTEEGACMETLMVIDDSSKVQNALPERPLKRFTRSALKPKAVAMEISATSGGSVVSENAKETKNDAVKLHIKEEASSELLKSSCEEKCQSDLARRISEVEPKNDQEKSLIEDQLKKEGTSVETPMVIDDGSAVQKAMQERTPRRFTRSALKPKSEPMDISTTNTSSETVVSEDANNGVIAKGNSKTTDVVGSLRTPPKNKLEMKMSKKIALTKFPSKIKELLDTGMLEGLPVKYLYRNKKSGFQGVIKEGGILCSCTSCRGCKVVTPVQFEQHAGSLNKRPADYIYLENGNSIRDVLNACKDAPLDTLEATIQSAIGSSPVNNATICQNCRGSFIASRPRKAMLLCNSCLEANESQDSPASTTTRSSKPVLTPISSNSMSKCISPPNKSSQGKITRKDLRLHKLVFEEDGLPDGTEVAYYARGQKLLEGYKKGFGIFCRCCNSEVSPSQFEAHAGWASRRKPYLHIYTSNGVSLHELSLSLSKGRKFSVKDNDDLCTICADGGDLLLCDGCPRAFHKDCVSLPNVPRGDWYCKYCQNQLQKENFGEHYVNAKAAGRVSGVDPIEQISKRCIRIVKTSVTEVGGCVLCRGHGFSKAGFGPRTVLLCDQCEKEFHVGCLKDHKMADLKELPKGKWFCCADCCRIHSALQKLLVHGSQKLPDSFSSVIKKKHEARGSDNDADLDVRWRLLSGKIASPETRLLLSKAVAIFHDRFDPIVDSATGRDLIPSMVYGRNIRDQEFGGMYCALLTVNSSVVSAGILRIFGQEVAELPLVATSSDNQGQGYFQTLFCCIERFLGFLNVKNLVLPAADEAESIWTDKFGFQKIAQDQLSQLRRDCQMMTFQGTSMLQKSVPKCRIIGKSSEDS